MEKINEKQLNELLQDQNESKVVVIDFYADWCGPCKMLGPVLEEVSKELNTVSFYKVNVDEENELAHKYHVSSIPTVILFKGGKPLEQSVGFKPKDSLIEWISKHS